MELKSESGLGDEALEELSIKALEQIHYKRYDLEMRCDGINDILMLGIAFSGKKVKMRPE